MNGTGAPRQGIAPLLAKELNDVKGKGDDLVEGLSPCLEMLHEFVGWACPPEQETQTPYDDMDESRKPLLSSSAPCITIADSDDDIAMAQLSEEDAATVRDEICQQDDILLLDGIERDELVRELEAIEVRKLVKMAEVPDKEQEIIKYPPVIPVLNGITAIPPYHKKEARSQFKEIREARQDIDPPPPEKKARLSKMVRYSSMTNHLADKQQEKHKRDYQSSPLRAHDWMEDYHSMERSVEEPPSLISYQARKKSLDAASDSVKELAASLSSNDEEENRLWEVNPNESNVSEPFEFEDYEPRHDCSPGLWNRTLGVNPEGRAHRLHKKIPSNQTRLRPVSYTHLTLPTKRIV